LAPTATSAAAVAWPIPREAPVTIAVLPERSMQRVCRGEWGEAFAVQTLYCRDRLGMPMERLNVDGGAIAEAAFGATVAPAARSGSALAAVRFQTVVGCPPARKRRASADPMLPSPMTVIALLMVCKRTHRALSKGEACSANSPCGRSPTSIWLTSVGRPGWLSRRSLNE